MGQVARFVFGLKFTITMAFAALVHFRLGVNHVYPLAQNDFAGPFTHAVDLVETVVPIAIAILLVVVWVWVVISPIQEEQRVRRRVRR